MLKYLFFVLPFMCSSVFGNTNNPTSASGALLLQAKAICEVLHLDHIFENIKVNEYDDSGISSMQASDGHFIIFINAAKLRSITKDTTAQKIAIQYSLAHEIGHIVSSKYINMQSDASLYYSFLEELVCDKLAGSAVALLNPLEGGSIIEQTLFLFLDQMESAKTHPPVIARIMSARSGWLQEMLNEDIYMKIVDVTYNKKAKKYEVHWLEEPELEMELSNNRFLVEINTFEDNRLAYKIMNFSDQSLSYIEAPPKKHDIVKDSSALKWDDEKEVNYYRLGNDYSLYDNAYFIFRVIPEKEFASTRITFRCRGIKYIMTYTKGPGGGAISLNSSDNTIHQTVSQNHDHKK